MYKCIVNKHSKPANAFKVRDPGHRGNNAVIHLSPCYLDKCVLLQKKVNRGNGYGLEACTLHYCHYGHIVFLISRTIRNLI